MFSVLTLSYQAYKGVRGQQENHHCRKWWSPFRAVVFWSILCFSLAGALFGALKCVSQENSQCKHHNWNLVTAWKEGHNSSKSSAEINILAFDSEEEQEHRMSKVQLYWLLWHCRTDSWHFHTCEVPFHWQKSLVSCLLEMWFVNNSLYCIALNKACWMAYL